MQILLIEHDDVGGLFPFSETHCSWELRCGAFTIHERWARTIPGASITFATNRDLHLQSFVERFPHATPFQQLPTLIMSGHVLLSPSVMQQVVDTCSTSDKPILFFCNGHAVGAYLTQSLSSPYAALTMLEDIDIETCRTIELSGHSINRLWHAFDHINEAIHWDASLISTHIDPSTTIHATVVIDESKGPVLVMEGAVIGAYAVLSGPLVIGERSQVKPHSLLSTTVIGPVCKISGEIENCVIHGFTNKQHTGYLGHSYLCEWVNLGAGTQTSNLRNTYGHVEVSLPSGIEDSQRMFIGLLAGDHTKTAIGTLLNTGTACGASCSIAVRGFPPKYIPSFTWMTQKESTLYDIEKAIDVARIVMARRMVDLGPATEALLRSLHNTSNA